MLYGRETRELSVIMELCILSWMRCDNGVVYINLDEVGRDNTCIT